MGRLAGPASISCAAVRPWVGTSYSTPAVAISAAGYNDAHGIADLRRVNKYRSVWVKSPEAQRQGRLLTARAILQSQLVALENTIRGLLRQEGIGLTDKRTAFEAAVSEAIGDDRMLGAALDPLLETRNAVLQHRATLDRQILRIVRTDPVCRLLMTAHGVGALISLAFKIAVDDPRRFSRSCDVGAPFGFTPREYNSVTSGRRLEFKDGPHLSASFRTHLGMPKLSFGPCLRRQACAFGAPLRGCGA